MAETSSRTPLMADNDHDHDDGRELHSGEETHLSKNAPASAYFKRIIRNMNIVTAVFLALIFGLAIATIIVLNSGPWDQRNVWRKEVSQSVLRSLAICLGVNFLLTLLTLLVPLPILIDIAINIALSIPILIYSSYCLSRGWPDSSFCRRYRYIPPTLPSPENPGGGRGIYEPLPESWECLKARHSTRIMMAVVAGSGIVISIMILCVLFLRVLALGKALAKTKSWKRYVPKGWKSRGFTVQFSFSIAPYDVAQGRSRNAVARGENGEEGRLIET